MKGRQNFKMQSFPVSTTVTFVQVDFSFDKKILSDGINKHTCSFETKVIQIEVRFDLMALVKRLLGGAIGWTWAWV